MCFSAEVSFGASAAIAAIGAVSLKKAETPQQKVFAMIPVFFAIQQCMEGILWLTLSNASYQGWEGLSTHAFLFFAWIVWPVYIPLSTLLLEEKKIRRRLLSVFLGMGILVSLFLAYRLLFQHVHAEIAGMHIRYTVEHDFRFPAFVGTFYFIPIVVSLYVSSRKRMSLVATVILLSFIATVLFYNHYLISVWCFFSAITSIAALWVIYGMNESPAHEVALHGSTG